MNETNFLQNNQGKYEGHRGNYQNFKYNKHKTKK
jgi:hypothetical protein